MTHTHTHMLTLMEEKFGDENFQEIKSREQTVTVMERGVQEEAQSVAN